MKVLFVSSGNKKFEDSPIVRNQGESIRRIGIKVEFFYVIGRGLVGYFQNILRLRRFLKLNTFDLIHAHYSLSAIVASLAGGSPVVASLMGSDTQAKTIMKFIISFFSRFCWRAVIVKAERMKVSKILSRSLVIPNGVNFEVFQPIDKDKARQKIGFNKKKHIIFVANPDRREKNYHLAEQAFQLINDPNVELNIVSGVNYKLIPYYYYAADVLLLTSLWEGSPNVVKEAMACNLPIVSTDVGDVREVIGKTDGCYITTFEPGDVAEKLKMALAFGKRTNGREHISHLDSNVIAKKIIKIYEKARGGNR